VLVALVPLSARAEKTIWHYDDKPSDMKALANDAKQHPSFALPGFVAQEAYGVMFRPKAGDYPVKILTVELVMAQPPSAPAGQTVNATIEFYNSLEDGPNPKGKPVWSVNTQDFAAGGQPGGQPIVGNTGMIYEFDWTKPENHPPLITDGNIWVMVRYLSEADNLGSYWGDMKCDKIFLDGFGDISCGCSKLAVYQDNGLTPQVNVMHIGWDPAGMLPLCKGPNSWFFADEVKNADTSIKGDFVLRMGVEGSGSGGGGSGGSDASSAVDSGSSSDDAEFSTPAPVIDSVLPSTVAANTAVKLEVDGKNFLQGAKVKLFGASGSFDLSEVTVATSGTTLQGTTPPLSAGTYDLKVTNIDGKSGVKTTALLVSGGAATPDAGSASLDGGSSDGGGAGGKLVIDGVSTTGDCLDSARDTQVTIYGKGFQPGMSFEMEGKALVAVEVSTSGTSAKAILLKGQTVGTHTLVAKLADGTTAIKPGIAVAACSAATTAGTAAKSGCDAGRTGAWPIGSVLALALVGLGLRRRIV
jgi:hypothetical protein